MYDIDTILAEEERVPVVFNGTADKHELPLWLAQVMHEEDYGQISLPHLYGPKFSANLKADPVAASLKRMPYYYELGLRIAHL